MNNIMVVNSTAKMNSIEIAALVGKRHDNVRRTIETLAKNCIIQLPQIEEVNNNQSLSPNSKTKAFIFEGEQGKRDSIIVVAQLSPEFTARLVDRWQELEKEVRKNTLALPDFTDPAAAAEAWAKEYRKAKALESKLEIAGPKADFVDSYVDTTGTHTFRQVAKLLNVKEMVLKNYLFESGMIYRINGTWLPHHYYKEHGYMTVKTGAANGHSFVQVRFTAKGIEYLRRKIAKDLGAMLNM